MLNNLNVDLKNVPPELKQEGSDWFAIFTPIATSGEGTRKPSMEVELVHTLLHDSVVCCVRFSADGRFLATGCNKTAQIYDTTTAVKMCTLSHVTAGIDETRDMYVRCVYFSPDDKYLAAGGEDKQIRVWDIAERRVRMTFEGHQHEVYSLVFSHDGRWIVSGSGDRTVRIWDVNQGTIHKILTVPERENADAGVTSVCISPDGRLVAAGSLDFIVYIWDFQSGQLLSQLNAHRDSVYSVVFTPDGYGRPRLTASPLKHPHRCRGVLESMRIVRERQR